MKKEDRMEDVKKMLEKKQKKKKTSDKLDQIDASLQDIYANLPSPKLKDSLPYRFSVWLFHALIGLPNLIKASLSKRKTIEDVEEDEETNAQLLAEQEYQKKKAQTSRLHKELNPTKIEKSDIAAPVITYNLGGKTSASNENVVKPSTSNSKEWTDKQKNDLIKVLSLFLVKH